MTELFFAVLLGVLFLSVLNNHYNEKLIKMQARVIRIKSDTIKVVNDTLYIKDRTIAMLDSVIEEFESGKRHPGQKES